MKIRALIFVLLILWIVNSTHAADIGIGLTIKNETSKGKTGGSMILTQPIHEEKDGFLPEEEFVFEEGAESDTVDEDDDMVYENFLPEDEAEDLIVPLSAEFLLIVFSGVLITVVVVLLNKKKKREVCKK